MTIESRLTIRDTTACGDLDQAERQDVRGGFSFNWFTGSFWKTRKLTVEGGTIKTGDYETGGGDTGPSDKDLLGRIGKDGRTPRTPSVD